MTLKDKISALKQKIKSRKPVGRGKHGALKKVYQTLVLESNNLINSTEDVKKSHEQELANLRAELARSREGGGGSAPRSDEEKLHELEAENYLLQEVNEALIKEKAELEKVIASLETDNQQQKEEFEKKLAQSQQSVERIEERLVDCCSKCLMEEEETKENLNKTKKEIFQLCERMGVEISPQLKKDIEKANSYKDLLTNLIKIHDARMIEINQEASEEETKPAEVSQSQISPSTSQSKVNPGVKYFLWITGILALVSFILFIVKKGKLGTSKPGKKQK